MKALLQWMLWFIYLGSCFTGVALCVRRSQAASNHLNLQQQSNGIAVFVDGKLVGNAVSLNFTASTGVVQVCSAAGGQVNCSPSYNTATLATKQSVQRGDATRCVPTLGNCAFTCGTNPVGTPTTIVPGTELQFVPDVSCTQAQGASLNVDSTGLMAIKANNGGNTNVAFAGNGHIVHHIAADKVGTSLIWRLTY